MTDDNRRMRSASPEAGPATPPEPLASARWHVDGSLLALKLIGAVAFGVIPPVFGLNPASRWFGLLVAILLAVYGIRDVVAPIRLAADQDGLTVVAGYAGHRRVAWSQIERLRVDSRRRAEFLEVDTGEALHLFSRYDLSMPPHDALNMLERIRP